MVSLHPSLKAAVHEIREVSNPLNPVTTYGTLRSVDTETLYEIARYREYERPDDLIDRIQLVRNPDGSLNVRYADGRETLCAEDDPLTVIATNQDLHTVRPNELTHIQGTKEIRAELPLVLRALDAEVHGEKYEVCVDYESWGVIGAADRMWVLPSDCYELDFIDEWARISFIETGSMTSGTDTAHLGMITPTLVADFCNLDGESARITVSRREDDAKILADWLLDGHFSQYFCTHELIVQLFMEAVKFHQTTVVMSGQRLAAGVVPYGDFGTSPTAEWSLDLKLGTDVRDDVLEKLRARGGHIAAIVDGGLNPDSAIGRARATALKELGEPQNDDDEDQDDEDEDWDDEDDDPEAPWNRSAVERLPKVISPGEIPVRFWRRVAGQAKPIAFDLVFSWGGEREANWSYGPSTDNADVPANRFASFQGAATWTDGMNVHLTYSSPDSGLGGETTLNAAAPMLISPSSDVFMKIPMAWVDLAMKIIAFLRELDRE